MSDFLRPEARAALNRWREAVIGGLILLVALQYAWGAIGVRRGLAMAAALVGLAICVEGIRRARLPRDGGGAGVVEIDERQITYFGPDGGGAVAVEGLARIEAQGRRRGQAFDWVFTDMAGEVLIVPSDAEGALAIFDAVSVLKGVRIENVAIAAGTAALDRPSRQVIWQRATPS